jgi:hypothetical protein
MPQPTPASPKNSMLMRLYLLFVAALILPIALSYGIDPVAMLPKILDMTVTGTDQIHIFRAMMFLYLGACTFWLIAAFNPAWQRIAVIWAVIFALSLAVGRAFSFAIDGRASPLLDIYFVLEVLGSLLGLAVLRYEDRKAKQ